MMIITCINCSKKFNVNSELIPDEGRTIQCGSCKHVWFFNKNEINLLKLSPKDKKLTTTTKKIFDKTPIKSTKNINKLFDKVDKKIDDTKGFEIIKYQSKTNFTFAKFFYFLLVLIISFIALILVLDTFKSPLYDYFPNLEFLLFNLYETLKDIKLFIIDLI